MSTLKIQLGLTLSILLFLSMFLFGLVMLMLWQKHSLRQETNTSLDFMENLLLSEKGPEDFSAPDSELLPLLQRNNIECLQWKIKNSGRIISYGNCHDHNFLEPLLQQTVNGKRQINYSGLTWNGVFFSRSYLLAAIPAQETNSRFAAVGISRTLEKVYNPIKSNSKIFYAYLIANLLLFTTIGFTRLIHLIIRPIQRLSLLADSRTKQEDPALFSEDRWGEFTQLTSSLNRLVTRIDGDKQELKTTIKSLKVANEELQKNRDEMIRAEKLASIGRLSAGLAHEIGNPLGIIQGYVDMLADDSLDADSRLSFSSKAAEELDRINLLIRRLLELSHTPLTTAISEVDIHPLLKDIVNAVRLKKTSVEINYKTDFTANRQTICTDADTIRQVFLNCIINAIDAIEEHPDRPKGQIIINTANDDHNNITIEINDNGKGIETEYLDCIFDPFFTTKEVGKGTGLGLAVVHNIIKKSGGKLDISSIAGHGTTVTITLPLEKKNQYE